MTKFPALIRFAVDRRTLYSLAWLLALALAAARIINAHLCFQDRRPLGDPNRRVDGNDGHQQIDFGGQWLMGRMLATGHGRELFSRPWLREVAQRSYHRDQESPTADQHDGDLLVGWFMGDDDPRWKAVGGAAAALIGASNPYEQAVVAMEAKDKLTDPLVQELTHPQGKKGIGGPLYPPIHAFVMLPFALGDHSQMAYFAMQYVQTLLCFLAGLGVSVLSRGRFWWPMASLFILAYPGARGVIDLGQNSALTLALLIWGWTAMSRDRPALGGLIWGLLAYKPVWALSFFLLLLLIRQWRAALTMALTGAAIILATLPVVGIQSWLNWLTVGQHAARVYNVDENWVPLSRDLLGLPRRLLIDFTITDVPTRENPLALAASWALWALVLEITLRALALRGRRVPFTGPAPAMLILAAWMCTYHFMYYDALISAFGVCVLLADPRPFFRARTITGDEGPLLHLLDQPNGSRPTWLVNSFALTAIALLLFHENGTRLMVIEVTGIAHSFTRQRTLANGTTEMSPRLIVGTGYHYPVETLIVIVLWAWCVMASLWGWPVSGVRSQEPGVGGQESEVRNDDPDP
jgi:arabinofuranan 3-O-arabinosyltransferase